MNCKYIRTFRYTYTYKYVVPCLCINMYLCTYYIARQSLVAPFNSAYSIGYFHSMASLCIVLYYGCLIFDLRERIKQTPRHNDGLYSKGDKSLFNKESVIAFHFHTHRHIPSLCYSLRLLTSHYAYTHIRYNSLTKHVGDFCSSCICPKWSMDLNLVVK